MQEKQLGISYSWQDLAPVRGVFAFIVAAQLAGLGLGALFPRFDSRFDSAWFGGAIATFPAFVLALLIQLKLNRSSIAENKRMVWHLGLMSAVLSAFALVIPTFGLGE